MWDYPRPPRVVADTREVAVFALGVEIARTQAALRVLETSHPPTFYLPRNDVKMAYLVPAGGGSRCEWKGEASYFDIVVAEQRIARVSWSYERPFDDAAPLAGHLAFYASLVEATVGAERFDRSPAAFMAGGSRRGWPARSRASRARKVGDSRPPRPDPPLAFRSDRPRGDQPVGARGWGATRRRVQRESSARCCARHAAGAAPWRRRKRRTKWLGSA